MIKCPTHPDYVGLGKPTYKGPKICWCKAIFEAREENADLEIFYSKDGRAYIISFSTKEHDGLWHWMNCVNHKECQAPHEAASKFLCGSA